MAWDGNGNFLRLFSWVTDKANGINITASRVDAEDNGFASAGFGNCITRDGQGKATANLTPATTAVYDVGSSGLQWVNGWFSGKINAQNVPLNKVKATTTSRASVTTPSNDPDLAIALGSGLSYAIELFAPCTSVSATTGIAFNLNYSGSINSSAFGTYWGTAAASGVVGSPGSAISTTASAVQVATAALPSGTGNPGYVRLSGTINTASTGTLGFAWAQTSSSANALAVLAGSWLRVVQLV